MELGLYVQGLARCVLLFESATYKVQKALVLGESRRGDNIEVAKYTPRLSQARISILSDGEVYTSQLY